MSLLKDFFGPFDDSDPGTVELGDCESLTTHLKTEKMIAEEYAERHFLSTQQAFGEGEMDNVFRVPGTENPADGLTKVRSDMEPLLRLLESGHFYPGSLRPLKGVAWNE